MKIEPREIRVRELVEGYHDNGEGGVKGYGKRLDIRPPFQREFVYNSKDRKAVIDTVVKGFPLNVMYWSDRGDGTYEIIDGQQRTISIAQYVEGDFSYNRQYFDNMPLDKREAVMNYVLTVYVCTGTDSEKLEWFKTINIAGKELTPQELRNAVYAGTWVTDAKRYFSRAGIGAHQTGRDYLKGKANRQDYLETAIEWISKGNIEDYMGKHQHDANAEALWNHFQQVIDWVKMNFTEIRKEMKGVNWGKYYDEYKDQQFDPIEIEKELQNLFADDEVQKKSGIYPYVITREEKHLNLRTFKDHVKQEVYEEQIGVCANCKKQIPDISNMEADHIDPWSKGGKTVKENCQMLCKPCNRRKGAQ